MSELSPTTRADDEATAGGAPGHRNDGFTVPDGAAMVVAAAFASLHIRGGVRDVHGVGWSLIWLTFAGVAITNAGTFVYLARRFGRRPMGYPRRGDRLWAMLGLPWILAAPLRNSSARSLGASGFDLYGFVLSLGVAATCLAVLASLWKSFVIAAPGVADKADPPPAWTDRLGTALAIAWPFQCGFLLIVLDSESLPSIAAGP